MKKANLRAFNSKKVSELDSRLWISYYKDNKNYIPLFIKALSIMKFQLSFSWIAIGKLAIHTTNAARNYRFKRGNENYDKSLSSLIMMYKVVSNNCTIPFDYKKAAASEIEWWDVERYPENHNQSLAKSLSKNMALVFSVETYKTKEYGEKRSQALELIKQSSDKHLDDKNALKFKALLDEAWGSLHRNIN